MAVAEPFLFVLLLLARIASSELTSMANTGATTTRANDHLALMSFKSLIRRDPSSAMSSWGGGNNHSVPMCQWRGVTCGVHGRRRSRVVSLDLGNLALVGTMAPSLTNLTYLRRLHLPMNHLHGAIPSELGRLLDLKHLNLSYNSLGGSIPPSLSQCRRLEYLSVAYNNLTGSIPSEIGSLVGLLSLLLNYNHLTGPIPSSLANLQRLQVLHLRGNRLSGPVPSFLGNLSALVVLNLGTNNLEGEIVPLQGLSSLRVLVLQENNLQGSIPPWLGNLSLLTYLSLGGNSLTGSIPEFLGKLEKLSVLVLAENNLTGSIPSALGNLHALTWFYLDRNQLTGSLPSSLFNFSSLTIFNVQDNQIGGSFPTNMGIKFQNLQRFQVNFNQFHGVIPPWLCNASMLEMIQLEGNTFSGIIPPCLGDGLNHLSWLTLASNQVQANQDTGWEFLSSLTNCSRLRILDFSLNKFQGALPNSIANLSTNLQAIDVQYNMISSKIPEGIGNIVNLSMLYMAANFFEGAIPASVGRLQKLSCLDLRMNNLSGQIPPTLGNLTTLNKLYLGQNSLTGYLPSSLRSCPLELLDVHSNMLTGPIPKEAFLISTLSDFMHVQDNLFTGPLPSEIGNLKNLVEFDFSRNRISGEIPATLGECQSLQYLKMQRNFLQGTIPSSIGQLKGLQALDLSHDNLSGQIPQFLGSMRGLETVNLSFNSFEGEVPKGGIFLNASAISIEGNHDLCGGVPQLKLPPCSNHTSKKWSWKLVMAISIGSVVLLVILLLALFAFLHQRSKSRRAKTNPHTPLINLKHMRVSYAELFDATNGFTSENLIGVGSFGSVYKGRIGSNDQEKVVAVKVLNLQQRGASQSFEVECETLRCVRHRNLVKILTVCSSIDFRGSDFKALVFEFMPNGNLDQWLHWRPEEDGEHKVLDLIQRLCIAIDVASALDYLHQYKPLPIVHCDLKPSNVLMDENMVAHVGDFGLARFLCQDPSDISEKSSGWAAMRGTIGYAAPEYGLGNEVSMHGDVYSYGILLLEMFTGKRPTNSEFVEALYLHKYVEMALPEQAVSVIDQCLLSTTNGEEESTQRYNDIREARIACVVSILRVGILCSKESPTDRMQIGDAIRELQAIKDKFQVSL